MASLIKRKKTFYVQYCVGGTAERRNLETSSLQPKTPLLSLFPLQIMESGSCR